MPDSAMHEKTGFSKEYLKSKSQLTTKQSISEMTSRAMRLDKVYWVRFDFVRYQQRTLRWFFTFGSLSYIVYVK